LAKDEAEEISDDASTLQGTPLIFNSFDVATDLRRRTSGRAKKERGKNIIDVVDPAPISLSALKWVPTEFALPARDCPRFGPGSWGTHPSKPRAHIDTSRRAAKVGLLRSIDKAARKANTHLCGRLLAWCIASLESKELLRPAGSCAAIRDPTTRRPGIIILHHDPFENDPSRSRCRGSISTGSLCAEMSLE
jgi:hypothetical protein